MGNKLSVIIKVIRKGIHALTGADMQYILFWVILTYSLPLLGIAFSAYITDSFALDNKYVYISAAISAINTSHLRDIFGSMLVPIVTIFSVKISSTEQDQRVPLTTKCLFTAFIAIFLSSSILYGIVTSNESSLKNYGSNVYDSFKEITAANMKEALIYVAMTIGISIKK